MGCYHGRAIGDCLACDIAERLGDNDDALVRRAAELHNVATAAAAAARRDTIEEVIRDVQNRADVSQIGLVPHLYRAEGAHSPAAESKPKEACSHLGCEVLTCAPPKCSRCRAVIDPVALGIWPAPAESKPKEPR